MGVDTAVKQGGQLTGVARSALAEHRPPVTGTLPVTAVIPAYNSAETVSAAVASALAQCAGRPAEVLVIDDGSTDETARRARQAGAEVISHGENRGLAAARNTGLRHARHEWVALLDSDDQWLLDHLGSLWPHRNGHVIVAHSALFCRKEGPDRGPGVGRPATLSSPARLIFPENIIPVGASLLHRQTVIEAGGFRSTLGVLEDFDLWLRLLERGSALVLPKPGLRYNVYDGQMSSNLAPMHQARLLIIDRYVDRPWWPLARERWLGVSIWDMAHVDVWGGHHLRAVRRLGQLFRNRQRLVGLAMLCAHRSQVRLRTMRLRRRWLRELAALEKATLPSGCDGDTS